MWAEIIERNEGALEEAALDFAEAEAGKVEDNALLGLRAAAINYALSVMNGSQHVAKEKELRAQADTVRMAEMAFVAQGMIPPPPRPARVVSMPDKEPSDG